jgi:tetratricopeptide (TPR) repeat protein
METKRTPTAVFGHKLLKIVLCGFVCVIVNACATDQNNTLPETKVSRAFEGLPYPGQSIDASDIEEEDLPEMSAYEHEKRGDVFLQRENRHLALLQYEKALEKDPGNIRLEYKKGLALLLTKQYDDAIDQLKIVLEIDGQHAAAYEGLGTAYFHKNRMGKAQLYLEIASKKDPKLWKCHNLLGYIHDFNGHHALATAAYQKAILNKPREGSIYNNLGVSYSLTGKYLHAIHAFQQAIKYGHDGPKVYNNIGVSLSHLGKYKAAFEAFKKGLGTAYAYNNLGCIYMEKGKLKEAKNCFEKAIEFSPRYYVKAGENLRQVRALMEDGTSIRPAS